MDILDEMQRAGENGFSCPEAEENVLRRMLTKKGVAEDLILELQQSDFTNPTYGLIFRAIRYLVQNHRQVDMVSIDQALEKNVPGSYDPAALAGLMVRSDYALKDWQDIAPQVQIVKKLAVRRRAIERIGELFRDLHDVTKDVDDVLTDIQVEAATDTDTDAEWEGTGNVLMDTYEYAEKRSSGKIKCITTGIVGLDRLIGGFFDGEFTVVAARPSVGKSAFGLNIAISAALEGHKVGFVSCEMGDIGMGQRILSHIADVDGMKLRKGEIGQEDWDKLAQGMSAAGNLPVEFLFRTNVVEDIVNTVRVAARKGKMDMVIVDYLQFLQTRQRFKEERLRIGYISHMLKNLAKEANIPVIALAQVTRAGEGTMPTMKMLRESGDIEQDADGIIFLHRPETPEDESVHPKDKNMVAVLKERGMAYIALGVAKQRNGTIGQVNVVFDPSVMRYTEIDRRCD